MLAVLAVGTSPVRAGCVGGFTAGRRLLARPLNLSLVPSTGVGGIDCGNAAAEPAKGSFIGFVEADLDMNTLISRKFMPMIYTGHQPSGKFVPGRLLESFVRYTPVIGARICSGKHY
jgi:hypothetical protein